MNYTTFKTIVNTIEHLDVQHHNAKQIYGQVLHTEVLEALAPTTATDKLYGLLYSEMKTHAKTALDAFKHSGFGRIISDKKSPLLLGRKPLPLLLSGQTHTHRTNPPWYYSN